MANASTFVDFALDLLSLLGPVQAKRMFGGHGLYARGVMFGLLDDDELFLKTDAESRGRFVEAGCRMWVYPGMSETNYYRPPDEAHEEAEAMLPWAQAALETALRARAAKAAKAAATQARREAREAKQRTSAARPSTGSGRTGTKAKASSKGKTPTRTAKRPARKAAGPRTARHQKAR